MKKLIGLVATVLVFSSSYGQEVQSAPVELSFQSGATQDERAMAAFSNRFYAQTDAWFDDGDFWLCIQVLEMMVAWYPDSYELVTNLGWMYGNIEDDTNSLRIYSSFRERYPDNPEAAYPEAQFHYFKRNYEKVIALLEPTLKMSFSPHANTYRILGQSYRRTGKLKDALRIYELLVKKDPNDLAAIRNRDAIAQQIKDGGG